MNPSISVIQVKRMEAHGSTLAEDVLAVEEPLEIRLDYLGPQGRLRKSISITMRTPGYDFELAAGFLFTEGLIQSHEDIQNISYCGSQSKKLGRQNVLKVELQDHVKVDLKRLERHFYTSSSCGVCGKSSIEALKVQNQYSVSHRDQSGPFFKSEMIHALPDLLRNSQAVFESTGGLHASGMFSEQGELISVREDVGRHNALDKVIGDCLLRKMLPLSEYLLLLSGRVSFELVQKASMAGISIIAAVGAPSSLAFELAREMNMTLIGFARNQRYNLYHGEWRII